VALAITEDLRTLADVARGMVTDRAALGAARSALDAAKEGGAQPERKDGLWKEIVSVGWLGLHIDERYGGQGYGLPELTVVVEELGRAAAPGPFLPTVVTSAVIAEAGTDEQRERWLSRLSSGALTAGIALDGSIRLTGSSAEGEAPAVLADGASDLYLVVAGDDVVVLEPGDHTEVEVRRALDGTRPVVTLRCAGSPAADVLTGGAAAARRLFRTLTAAEAVGGLHACAEMAVAYAMSREQFGQPIGSFQAVKHHCANMFSDAQLAAAVVWDAARGADDPAEADLAAAIAAAHTLPAYQRVAELNIQVHGGIGYTWEHDAHLYLRRAAALCALTGVPDAAREQVTQLRRDGVRRRHTIDLPPEAQQYRQAAREFATEHARTAEPERQKHYARSGYLLPHWPAPYGRAATPVEQLVIDEELADLERPSLGLGEWVLPTLLQHGTPEQIEQLMWPSLDGEIRWCQLFSEPGAGSDAAAVATKARRVEGGWQVTGQKVWTSDARNCQRGLATVRTDPDVAKHKGITAMIIDLSAPGVQIRPLTEITGEAMFNEVFFDDVFVPDDDVLGEVNSGWRVAMATFGNERVSIGGGSVTMVADELVELLDKYRPGDTGLAREVGALLVESHALAMLNVRQAARAVADAAPGVEGNLAKLFGAEHAQRVVQLGMRISGPAALIGGEPKLVHDFFFSRCLTIAGGTSEIVRNLVAERILGLPR
jgi:alkylation response protein AidB-like acyl-CoA dehydrogenase